MVILLLCFMYSLVWLIVKGCECYTNCKCSDKNGLWRINSSLPRLQYYKVTEINRRLKATRTNVDRIWIWRHQQSSQKRYLSYSPFISSRSVHSAAALAAQLLLAAKKSVLCVHSNHWRFFVLHVVSMLTVKFINLGTQGSRRVRNRWCYWWRPEGKCWTRKWISFPLSLSHPPLI